MQPDKLAVAICTRHESLKGEQSQWRTTWDDVSRYVAPHKGDILTQNTPGQDQTSQIYDSTAEESALIMAAGLLSQMVPPGEKWMRLEPEDKRADAEAKTALDHATDRMLERIYASNFYLGIHEDFLDLARFGTSNTYVEEGTKRRLNFCNIPVGTFTMCEDNEGLIDTIYREWQWTAKQIEQQWPDVRMPDLIAKALASEDPKEWDRKFTLIHAVYPRRKGQFRSGLVEGKLRPIASVYVCKECQSVIEESGFYEMSYAAGRLIRGNNEVYGRGPGIQVLPEIKVLNRMEQDLLMAVERQVNPPWLMPEDASFRPDNRPGGVTYWDATNANNKPERVQDASRIDLGEQKTEQKRQRIRSAFFVDMFQMLSNAGEMRREKTAFEVAQMVQEKLLLFSPMFARIVQEKLNPMLERVFNIMLRAGEFDDLNLPEGLAYKITYTSKIAMAIKAAHDNALMELTQACALIAPFDQSVAMVVKWGEAFRAMARNRGLPADFIRDDEEVQGMMQQMQQAQAAMQAAQTAELASRTAKNLGPEAQAKASKAIPA